MSKFAALNEETESSLVSPRKRTKRRSITAESDDEPEVDAETLQQNCHALYNKGLGHYASKDYPLAIVAFEEVLSSKFLTKDFFAKLEISQKLKFSALKYLGFSYGSQKNFEKALPLLLKALQLDKDDVNLSIKVAIYAIKIGQHTNVALATAALENALRLSPNHFPCLELMINCTFELQDYPACLSYIDQALRMKPTFVRGLQLRSAILKSFSYFESLCPDGPHIRKDIPFTEVSAELKPATSSGSEDDLWADEYHDIVVGDVTWAQFLDIVVGEVKDFERKGLSSPMLVKTTYEKMICETKSETDRLDRAIAVSVQNMVQEMIDIVSGPTEAELVSESIVDDLLEASIFDSNKFMIDTILHEVLVDVVTQAVPSKKPSGKSSFLQEVPMDLLEIRRSSRVKETMENQLDECNEEEMTAQAILENFVPKAFRKSSPDQKKEKSNSKDDDETNDATENDEPTKKGAKSDGNKQDRKFPSDSKQHEQVKEFVEQVLHKRRPLEMIICLALEKLCKMSQYKWPKSLRTAYLKAYLVWRNVFVLPSALCNDSALDYIDVMILANEILVEHLKEDELEDEEEGELESEVNYEEFIDKDFQHLRMSFHKLSSSHNIRICYAEHQYYLEIKEIDKALYCGSMLVEDLLENVSEFSPPEWNMSGVKLNKTSLATSMSFLEHSKILHKVQEFFDDKEYQKVVDILSRTIGKKTPKGGGVEEDETWLLRLFMLMESLWELEKYDDCLDRSIMALAKAVRTEDLNDLTNILATIEYCWEMLRTPKLSAASGSSLCGSLISIMLGQINNTLKLKSVLPWILFYKVIHNEEEKIDKDCLESSDDIPMSVHFLVSAHDYTGQLSLCTDSKGKLLVLVVQVLTPLQKITTLAQYMQDSVKKNIDQALYCLYSHPSKKSKAKHLVDHGAQTLALTWDKCNLLYEVVRPSKLPEFDDYKSCSINSDAEALLRRFVALVPDEFNLKERADKVEDFFDGEDADFPDFGENNINFPKDMKDMFYLLGDYNFKNSNFEASLPFFRQDLTFNPHRLDSYIDMALASASSVETKISQSYNEDVEDTLRDAWAVLKIFRECQKKDGSNPTIYIECANFSYVMNAYCSRVIKGESNSLSMEMFNSIEKYKSSFLNFAQMSYKKAFDLSNNKIKADPNAADERWLVYMFIGKIMEKKNRDLVVCLRQYLKAMRNLKNQGEYISKKIVFNQTPQDLQVEFLEVFYRFHASILKLELQPGFETTKELISGILRLMEELNEISVFEPPADDEDGGGARAAKKPRLDSILDTSNQDEIDDDKEVEEVSANPPAAKKTKLSAEAETWEFVSDTCIANLERVKTIYPHHYKSLHLLASYFMGQHVKRDVERAKEYLLLTDKNTRQSTLFGDRKVTNIFNGIWRSPISELERAGSFPTHVAKCLSVLFEMLRETEDYTVFMEAVTALRKSVDGDKQYLFDKDRSNFYVEACTSLMQIVNTKGERFVKQENKVDEKKLRFCLDLYQFRGKKGLNKSHIDQIKAVLRKLYCSMYDKLDCTFEEMTCFMGKLNSADKAGNLKDLNSDEAIEKLLSECSVEKPKQPEVLSFKTAVTMPDSLLASISSQTKSLMSSSINTTPSNTLTTGKVTVETPKVSSLTDPLLKNSNSQGVKPHSLQQPQQLQQKQKQLHQLNQKPHFKPKMSSYAHTQAALMNQLSAMQNKSVNSKTQQQQQALYHDTFSKLLEKTIEASKAAMRGSSPVPNTSSFSAENLYYKSSSSTTPPATSLPKNPLLAPKTNINCATNSTVKNANPLLNSKPSTANFSRAKPKSKKSTEAFKVKNPPKPRAASPTRSMDATAQLKAFNESLSKMLFAQSSAPPSSATSGNASSGGTTSLLKQSRPNVGSKSGGTKRPHPTSITATSSTLVSGSSKKIMQRRGSKNIVGTIDLVSAGPSSGSNVGRQQQQQPKTNKIRSQELKNVNTSNPPKDDDECEVICID